MLKSAAPAKMQCYGPCNIFLSDFPSSSKDVKLFTYGDDGSVAASHAKATKAKQILNKYLIRVSKFCQD